MKETRRKPPFLEMSGIYKSFGGNHALKNASLSVEAGEVHALLGENGAGKSTLMKILMGLLSADAGTIRINGTEQKIENASDALRLGLSIVNQELNPQPYMTVAENIFLHREHVYGKSGFLNKKETNRAAQEVLDNLGFDIDARNRMADLSIAQMQMIEIVKAVSFDAKLVVLDEPTSSLTSREVDKLYEIIRDLKSRGIAIVYISHRMEELFEVCDRVSIYKDGEYVDTSVMKDITTKELIYKMAGDINEYDKDETKIGETILEVKSLTGKGFRNVSFKLREGEILGFYGLVGAGRSETMRAVFGIDSYESGSITLEGEDLRIRSPRDAIKSGIVMLPEDRKNLGAVLNRPIRENTSLASLYERQKGFLINKKKETQEVLEISRDLKLKAASIEHDVNSLSGGNQQKVVLAKWLLTNPKILILDEPTRGIDVAAKAQIHHLMSELAGQGMAIILISSELPEVMNMSDRLVVYYEGEIRGVLDRSEILSGTVTKETILTKAFGQ